MTPFFFGYGSLVNRATHGYENIHLGAAQGWKRAWRHTHHRQVAFLTAVPCPNSTIQGVIAEVPNHDWAELDRREYAYARLNISHQVRHAVSEPLDVSLYAIPADQHHTPSDAHPILFSYLGTVIQGYLNEFGADGVQAFFDTTQGWEAPILDDRACPSYPRAQPLKRSETTLLETHLQRVGCRVIAP